MAKAEVLSLKSHIEDTAKRLLSAVSGIPDQSAVAQPPTDHVSDSEEFTLVASRNAHRSKATQTTTPVTNTSAIVNDTASAGRTCPFSGVSSSRRTYRDTLVNGPPTVVIGTSLVKGVGIHLNKHGINNLLLPRCRHPPCRPSPWHYFATPQQAVPCGPTNGR